MSVNLQNNSTKSDVRVVRTVSIPAPLDRWINNLLDGDGEKKGKFSTLVQRLLSALHEGNIPRSVVEEDGNLTLERAAAYLKAKEASMNFERDVASVIEEWKSSQKKLKTKISVVRNRIHNDGSPFIADFSVQLGEEILCSVSCKSSPQPDRLQLALGEAIIGRQKTGKPVVTVVPYFLSRTSQAQTVFESMGLPIVGVTDLRETLERVLKDF